MREWEADVICLQETKLATKDKTPPTPDYTVLRQDRTVHRGGAEQPQGGLAILVRRGLHHEPCPVPAAPPGACLERLAVTVHPQPSKEGITIMNLYRPPVRTNNQQDGRDGGAYVDLWPDQPGAFIVGDINGHGSWDPNHAEDEVGRQVDEWLVDNSFAAFNTGEATRISHTGAGTAPDVTLGHVSWSTRATWKIARSIGSDHLPVVLDLATGPPGRAKRPPNRPNLRKADWDRYRHQAARLFHSWDPRHLGSPAKATKDFIQRIFAATAGCVPQGSLPRTKTWWTPQCTTVREEYHAALAHLRANEGDPAAMELHQAAKEHYKAVLEEAKTKSWQDFTATMDPRTPTSRVWAVVRSLDGRAKEPLPDAPVEGAGGRKAREDREKTELAAASYAATSRVIIPHQETKEAYMAVRQHLKREVPAHEDQAGQDFSYSELQRTLRKNGGKAAGPDQVHPLHLRKLPPQGKRALLDLINWTWGTGWIPGSWRRATIIPILKKGKSPLLIKSYRPVSLLSCISKVAESMLEARMRTWAEREDLIPASQAGFRRHRSTADAVNQIVQKAFDSLQHKPSRRTLIVAVDIKAAFDTVWRGGLLRKLADAGIHPRWLRWLRAFLTDRRANVRWNSATSRWRIFKEGLPQGSPLSPLLYLLYTASLPAAISAASPDTIPTSFADDLTLERADTDPQRAAATIQAALTATETWCENHHLQLAPEKTEALLVTVDPRQNNAKCRPPLQLCGTDVNYVRELKVLGVTIDSQLTMACQAKAAADKIRSRNRVLASIAARSWGADTDCLRHVYTSFGRPAGLYAAGAWMPYTSPTQEAHVQRADNEAARIITGLPAKTNAAVALREAGLGPARVVAAHEAACNLLHYLRFDEGHPLRRLAAEEVRTRIRRQGGERGSWRESARRAVAAAGLTNTAIEPLPKPDDIPPPWAPQPDVSYHETPAAPRDAAPAVRRAAALQHLGELRARGTPDIEVWTDGAAEEGVRNGGGGAILRHNGPGPVPEDTVISIPTGHRTDSTASEAAALAAGLGQAEVELRGQEGKLVWALFDSKALFERLQNPALCDSDAATARACRTLAVLGAAHSVRIVWVPGHAGLPLNERADEAAREGCARPQEDLPVPASAAKARLMAARKEASDRLYLEAVPEDHLHRRATGGRPLPPFRGRTSHRDVLLCHLRANRGRFLQDTLYRWGKADSPACPYCPLPAPREDVEHFLLGCPQWEDFRRETLGDNPDLHSVLQEHPDRAVDFVERAGISPPYVRRRDL